MESGNVDVATPDTFAIVKTVAIHVIHSLIKPQEVCNACPAKHEKIIFRHFSKHGTLHSETVHRCHIGNENTENKTCGFWTGVEPLLRSVLLPSRWE